MNRRKADQTKSGAAATPARAGAYPFTAIVGQDELKLALLLAAAEPRVGGVLAWGHRGTGKSTAVRALAELLPPLARVKGCPFNCDPEDSSALCAECRALVEAGAKLRSERAPVPVVELPLNATEDRVSGTLDVARALGGGALRFAPGLLARANRGFLYIDEVNLLEDHLVDLLLDAAASGRNHVEREGVAAEHAARFALVGSANPEEGELRPQLLDRFGLCAEVRTSEDAGERAEIVTRREAFDRDAAAFCAAAEAEQARLRRRLTRARRTAADVCVPAPLVRRIAELCLRLGVEGHRGELTVARAARALAALEGRREATARDVRRVAALALRHRLRQDPLGTTDGGSRVEDAAQELFGDAACQGRPASSASQSSRGDDDEHQAAESGGGAFGNPGGGADAAGKNGGDKSGDAPRAKDTDAPRKESEPARRVEGVPAPPADGSASFETFEAAVRGARKVSPFSHAGRGASRGRADDARRGRYFGAAPPGAKVSPRLAFDATARAAASRLASSEPTEQGRLLTVAGERLVSRVSDGRVARVGGRRTAPDDERRDTDGGGRRLAAEDLRFKRLSRKTGTLFILAVDASGSMAVNRIRQAKGALAKLLRKSYVERDRVALVSFRGRASELLLRPSSSIALAKRRLDALAVGGPTPLASALLRSLEVARGGARQGTGRVVLLVFTDGRANVTLDGAAHRAGATLGGRIRDEIERLGAALRRAGVSTAVVDTRARFDTGQGRTLAAALGATYARLEVS